MSHQREGRNRGGDLPEGAIQAASKFGAVCHERDLVSEAGIDQASFDRTNASVHHVTGGDAVCTGLGIVDGDLSQSLNRRLVVDRAVRVKDTAVAVRGIFAETNVGCDVERGESFPQDLDSLDYWAIGVVRNRALLVLSG